VTHEDINMSKYSINPGFFLRYFVAPAMAFAVMSAPTEASASVTETTSVAGPAALFVAGDELRGKVNINTASAKELELLPGIGPSTAQKIISYRARSPFKEPLHLLRVKGVGRKTYARIKPFLSVSGTSDLVSTKSKSKAKKAQP
jgi:competence protein ComEA